MAKDYGFQSMNVVCLKADNNRNEDETQLRRKVGDQSVKRVRSVTAREEKIMQGDFSFVTKQENQQATKTEKL